MDDLLIAMDDLLIARDELRGHTLDYINFWRETLSSPDFEHIGEEVIRVICLYLI
jgi:hypothetical protein